MAEWLQIPYEGQPVNVHREGQETEVVPFIYDTPDLFGVGIRFPDGSFEADGSTYPRDIFAAWRATQIVENCDSTELPPLKVLYQTVSRLPNLQTEFENQSTVLEAVGAETFSAIMDEPVPQNLIDTTIDRQREIAAPDLQPITHEAHAGTISWQERFDTLGIERPEQLERREQERSAYLVTNAERLKLAASYIEVAADTPEYEVFIGSIGRLYNNASLQDVDDITRIAFGVWETGRGLSILRPQGAEYRSNEDGEADQVGRGALLHAAQWMVEQSTEFIPSSEEYRNAVGQSMLQLTELQAKIRSDQIDRVMARRDREARLEPRPRPEV